MSLIINNDTNNFYPISIPEVDWHCDYLWSTHEGNFNGAGCEHGCIYCSRGKYNNRFKIPRGLHRLKGEWENFDGNDYLKRRLPEGGIFVDPYSDIMTFPKEDIEKILWHCNYEKSHLGEERTFIFQTKDPSRYFDYLDMIPDGSWLGTTIEETVTVAEYYKITKAPRTDLRHQAMTKLDSSRFKKFITIEPIMKLDYRYMRSWINDIKPDLVFIGANTSKIQLPEPTPDEVMALVEELSKITHVYLKSNLKRLVTPEFWSKWEVELYV